MAGFLVQAKFCCLCSIILFHFFVLFLKGEWKPKQIDNPAYKGEWVHPEIDNPDYKEDPEIGQFENIGHVGFEIWQVHMHFLKCAVFSKMLM